MNRTLVVLFSLLVFALGSANSNEPLVVYSSVPGLAPSEHYSVRVRLSRTNDPWLSAFAWQTTCKSVPKDSDAYFDTLAGWTHTYVNFESSAPVDVEISRLDGQPIRSAVVHPRRKASGCVVKNGKAFIRLEQPSLVAVDIDGQMDNQDTGKGYQGPPLHTISIFANPPIDDKPQPNDPDVRTVRPGEMPPSEGDWKTLYFLPAFMTSAWFSHSSQSQLLHPRRCDGVWHTLQFKVG